MDIKEKAMKSQDNSGPNRARTIAAALAVAMILTGAGGALAQGKRGALAIVTLRDDSVAAGELIAVRSASIVLLDSSGKDVSVAVNDIRTVRVSRSPKRGEGAVTGLFLGGLAGLVGGSVAAKTSGACPGCEAPMMQAGYALAGAGVGLVVGLLAGGHAGKDLVISFDDMPRPTLSASLYTLQRYARVNDAPRP
jgi:hypothetical protein